MRRSLQPTAGTLVLFVALVLAIMFAKPWWRGFVYRYGPREEHTSVCLLCNRNRVQSILYGFPPEDVISSNKVSDWIDMFYPSDHEHQWLEYCCEMRLEWTPQQPIGCCDGFAALATVCGQRAKIGEEKCRRLVLKFHSVIQPGRDFAAYDDFTKDVCDSPDWLLRD